MLGVLGVVAGLGLLVLPGAWLAFGLSLPGTSFRARISYSVILSTVVLPAQFYPLRWLGLSFAQTAIALAVVNLPALGLAFRRAGWPTFPRPQAIFAWSIPAVLVGAYLAIWTGDVAVRGNWGHAWLHSEITYMISNGELRPEEPMLAGIALAYPWLGHIQQALFSWLLDSAPGSSFMLLNIVTLVATVALLAELIAAIGGSRLAQVAGTIALCFGINYVGPLGERYASAAFTKRYPVWGDSRYEVWFRKFGVFQQNGFGIALCAAIGLLAVDLVTRGVDRGRVLLLAVLLTSVSLVYPILWPAAAVPVGAAALVLVVRDVRSGDASNRATVAWLALALVASFVAEQLWMRAVFTDRVATETMGLASLWRMKGHTATAAIALAPLWITALPVLMSVARTYGATFVVLALSCAGSLLLNIALSIVISNQYKYMFNAGFFLAPFAAIGIERMLRRTKSGAWPLLIAGSVVLAVPHLYRRYHAPVNFTNPPAVSFSTFDTRLAPNERGAALMDSIRMSTPKDAVVLSEWLPFDLATPTQRPLFVLSKNIAPHGLGVPADGLYKGFRGYSMDLVKERRTVQRELFTAESDSTRAASLASIRQQLGRPLALIVRLPEDARLDAWLSANHARSFYRSATEAGWLVEPTAPAPATIMSSN